MRPGRTILAVLVGYLAMIVFDIIGGVMLAGAVHGRQGGSTLIIGGEFVLFVSAIFAGAITARMAPFRPLSHAGALGLSIFSVSVLASAFTRPVPHQIYPDWYPYAAAVLGGFGAFVGGALFARSSA